MKQITIGFMLLLLFSANTCRKDTENCHYTMGFNNNSPIDVYVSHTNDYPDTIDYHIAINFTANKEDCKVHASSFNKVSWNWSCLEHIFTSGAINSKGVFTHIDTLAVFIYAGKILEDDSTLELLKRYDLSWDDLHQLDWTLSYPPTEAMKNIKQYPPYGK